MDPKLVSGLAITHVPQALMLQDSLMVDSTDIRTGGNENAASIIQRAGVAGPTCRTKQRAFPETAIYVIERPELVYATQRLNECIEIIVVRIQSLGDDSWAVAAAGCSKRQPTRPQARQSRRRTLWGARCDE